MVYHKGPHLKRSFQEIIFQEVIQKDHFRGLEGNSFERDRGRHEAEGAGRGGGGLRLQSPTGDQKLGKISLVTLDIRAD